MERIKRFLLDDTATAEATSTVVMIAAVGLLLAAGLTAWYSNLEGFFTAAGGNIVGYADKFALPGAS